MDSISFFCCVTLFVGLWLRSTELFAVKVVGHSSYENGVLNSFCFSTVNALITTFLGLLWFLNAPFVDLIAAFSLLGYFAADVHRTPLGYWRKHPDQLFHHIISFLSVSLCVILGGHYWYYCCRHFMIFEFTTIFGNMRWFMIKRYFKTDPVVFMLNQTIFIVSFICIRAIYGSVNIYMFCMETEVPDWIKAIGIFFQCLNLLWSFKIYLMLPLWIQMSALSFCVSNFAIFSNSSLSRMLGGLEFLITIVSVIYWWRPCNGWRRNLDIIVTLSVFGVHTVVCFYFQQWITLLSFVACLFWWYLGHKLNSNAAHLGVHIFACAGICQMHYDNIVNQR